MVRVHPHCGSRGRVGIRRSQGVGEKPGDRPGIGRDQREHRLLQVLVERGRLVTQAHQELPCSVGIVQRAMGPRLREAEVCRQQRQAVTGGRRQQDASEGERVEDLDRLVPMAGSGEKVDVEAGRVADRLAAAQEFAQLRQSRLLRAGSPQFLGSNTRQAQDRLRDRSPRVDEALHRGYDGIGRKSDRADLDDSVTGRVETGRLEVKGSVFRHRRSGFYGRRPLRIRGVDGCGGWGIFAAAQGSAIEGAQQCEDVDVPRGLGAWPVPPRSLGPCPINVDDYLTLIRSQSTGKANVTDASLKKALGTLELEQHVVDQIGGAMVSRASLFIFGAPGNGKSTITERMALLMGAPVEIPHAVAVGDEIIRVIDPVYHKIADGPQPVDRRLVKVERPVVVAGGELKLVQLDLTYDSSNRYYEAPLQWKANAGVFVIDDFGRQEVPPMRLLNRFIVPMEKKVDYLDLSASGRKIELPFLCQIVFSTNLSPTELVDEAFLRRMAYKIGVSNPSPEAFGRILRYECDRQGVSFDEKAIGYLLNNLYGKKPLRGSHPRALIARLVDLANYRQEPPRLTPQTLKEAFDACFNPALGSLTEDDWARPAIG